MLSIRSFSELKKHLITNSKAKKMVVVNPVDIQTINAIVAAAASGIVEPILIGNISEMQIQDKNLPFRMIDCSDLNLASSMAVEMLKNDEADILMKGLVNTDVILRAVLNKEKGIVPYGNVVTFIAAMEIPLYPRLLFVTDPAVIPAPNLRQRTAMIRYAIGMAHQFGIKKPKVALIHGTEKKNLKLPFMADYVEILEKHRQGDFADAVIDGPLDLFLALDKELGAIKNVNTAVMGDADILIFPGFDSANIFYKSMMTFAGAQMGGILFGTNKPVVLTSRSDSEASKFNSIALACLM
jgi:phosphate butyryltransferase